MIVRETRPNESLRVNEIFAIAFESAMTEEPVITQSDRCHTWAAFMDDDTTMMSTLTVSDFSIRFDDHTCRMGGMGGAATLPQYRRMGGIRGCFEGMLPHMYHNGYDFSYLYPFSTAYYRKFGYECCVQKYLTTVHLGLLNPAPVSGVIRMAEQGMPMTEAIRAVDEVWERKYNMMVQHREADYKWVSECSPAVKQEFTYVYFSADETPKAYTTFRLAQQADGRNLMCSRFFFVDQEGFLGLMHLFKSLSSDHMYVKFSLPAEPAMQYLMREWSLGAASFSIQPYGMVRVVNVESVLKKARYIGDGTLTLEITDNQIPENNGCFTISFQDGAAVSVSRGTNAPDASLSISTFSALISGVCDFHQASCWMDGLKVHNPLSALQQVFYRKNLMICDYF